MKDRTNNTITLVFKIDKGLESALTAFDPGLICAIGIDSPAEVLSITLLEENALQMVIRGKQVPLTFDTKPRFVYVRGIVQMPQGNYLTAIDRNAYQKNKEIIDFVLDALKRILQHGNDLYLLCPDRQVDFLLSDHNTWKTFQSPITTAISLPSGSILASIDGHLKIMHFHDVALFQKTGEEKWAAIFSNGNLGNVQYISHNMEKPIITSANGQISAITIDAGGKIRITNRIPQSSVRQMIGPLHNHPEVLAAVIKQSPNSVQAILYRLQEN